MSKSEQISRRDFLKLSYLGVLGAILNPRDLAMIEAYGLDFEVIPEVERWGRVGPEQLITQQEIDSYIKPSLVKLIDYFPGVATSEYCVAHQVITNPLAALIDESWDLGLRFWINCGFRDLDWQTQSYEKSKKNGFPSGYTAPPGRSQHHTGLAIDFQSLGVRPDRGNGFEQTKEGLWLDGNADRFGFVRSFLGGVNPLLATPEESWHYMYVGKDIAAEHFRRRMTNPDLEYYQFIDEILNLGQVRNKMWNKIFHHVL